MPQRDEHDRVVTDDVLFQVVQDSRALEAPNLLADVASTEPELAGLIQSCGEQLVGRLTLMGAPTEASQDAMQMLVRATALCVLALQRGHYELWRESGLDGAFAALDEGGATEEDTEDREDRIDGAGDRFPGGGL